MTIKEQKTLLGRYRDGKKIALDRIDTVRERQAEIRERFSEILADAPGEVTPEAEELMGERRALSEEEGELASIVPVFDEKIEAARADLAREAVGETFASAKKTAGGLVSEWSRHLERAEEAERTAEECREKAESGANRSFRLRWAVQAVGRLLGVEAVEIRTVSGVRPPRSPIRDHLGQGKLRRAGEEALQILDAEDLLSPEAKEAIEDAIADLDDDEEARRRREENKTRVDAQAAEQEEAREEVDAWLRDLLSDGPVRLERVRRAARANEVALVPRGTHGADLHSARKRLGIEVVERIEDPERPRPSWWAIPGTWDDEAFRRLGSGGATLAGAR